MTDNILDNFPEDIDGYLNEQEKRYPDIKPGTEKIINWHDPIKKTKTQYSIIYLHGFSATRQEISPVCERLASQLEANLFFTRLTGHGRTGESMLEISLDRLLHDANEALAIGKQIGERVIIIGNSTGATLATYLAVENHTDIFALVLLSPNYGLKRKSSELLLLPCPNVIIKLLQGPDYEFNPENPLQEKYWTWRYPSKVLISMMQLLKKVRNMPLQKINQPTLVLFCSQDQVIDINSIHKYIRRFGSMHLIIDEIKTPSSSKKHVIAGDILSPETNELVIQKIYEFIANIADNC